jgi:DNA-binding CsgD family transcriptional regulator
MDKRLAQINYSAYQFIKATHQRCNDICKPLYALGITRFRYTKIYPDGKHLTLDTAQGLAQQYLSQIKNLGKTISMEVALVHKSQPRILLPDSNINRFNKDSDPILHLSYINNVWNSIHIIKAENDSYSEIYTFSMTKEDLDSSSFYITNLALLERFTEYFREKASDLIESEDVTKLAHFDQSIVFGNKSIDLILEDKVREFLEATALGREVMNTKNGFIKLAPREVECLEYLSLGNSVKQIASFLDLSVRTIEFYINNAKEKTGYKLRQKLINEFINQKLDV